MTIDLADVAMKKSGIPQLCELKPEIPWLFLWLPGLPWGDITAIQETW